MKLWYKNPYFLNRQNVLWIWDRKNKHWIIGDYLDLFNMFDLYIDVDQDTLVSNIKNNYINAFERKRIIDTFVILPL